MTIQPAFEYADSAFFLFVQHCCILYFFLHFGRMPLSFFFFFLSNLRQGWQRHAPEKKNVGHEKVGSIGQKTKGEAHPQTSESWVLVHPLEIQRPFGLLTFSICWEDSHAEVLLTFPELASAFRLRLRFRPQSDASFSIIASCSV